MEFRRGFSIFLSVPVENRSEKGKIDPEAELEVHGSEEGVPDQGRSPGDALAHKRQRDASDPGGPRGSGAIEPDEDDRAAGDGEESAEAEGDREQSGRADVHKLAERAIAAVQVRGVKMKCQVVPGRSVAAARASI